MKFTKMVKHEDVQREWVVLDAKGKVFGRLLTEVATLLRGKHKPYYTPHVDCGDYVVIINASQIKTTGDKSGKNYYRHTGYFGGVKSETLGDLKENNPKKLFMLGARGMLPKTKLGQQMLKKLKVYSTEEHPHSAQLDKKAK
jgi:large subunit ribosomal protein L13